ncbi:MAG: single-stranded DNA-binding protein [Anaerolineae bacterium]|nr:single-stranded DNA-binding protein [Anaerolineae bacterium]
MSRGLNKVMIIGRLERDPEMRYTPNNRPVTSFSVATTHTWVSAEGERHEETEWFNVVAWGPLAKICQTHLSKGKQVYVEGRLKTRSWEDSAGKRHFRTEIVAREMVVLGDKDDDSYPLRDEYDDESDFAF